MHRFITKQRCESCKLPSFIRWRFHNDLVISVVLHFACSRCGYHGEVTLSKAEYRLLLSKSIPNKKEID